jgi:hypothetical protein
MYVLSSVEVLDQVQNMKDPIHHNGDKLFSFMEIKYGKDIDCLVLKLGLIMKCVKQRP